MSCQLSPSFKDKVMMATLCQAGSRTLSIRSGIAILAATVQWGCGFLPAKNADTVDARRAL